MSLEQLGIVRGLQERTEAVLAANVDRISNASVRRIQGKSPLFASAKETRITVDCRTGARTIEPVVREVPKPKPRPVPQVRVVGGYPVEFRRVAAAVCMAFGVDADRLLARGKCKDMALARFACFGLMNQIHGWSYVRTGQVLGRDLSGVRKGVDKCVLYRETKPEFREQYDAALKALLP